MTTGLRLGVAAWLLTALGVGGVVVLGAPRLAGLAGGAAVVLLAGARRWRSGTLLALALLVLVTSGVALWRVVPLTSGPLVALAGTRAHLSADLVLVGDPQTRSGRTSGARRTDDQWQVDAAILGWRAGDDRVVSTDLPVRVLTTDDVHGLLPGTRLHAIVRVLAGDPLRGRAASLVASDVVVTHGPPLAQGIAGEVRESLRTSVSRRPADVRGLLPGLVVGDTSAVPVDLDRAMRDSSLAHLTAVSGGNVAIVVLLALGASRLCGLRRGYAQVLVVGLVVAAYVVVARPQPSVMRAAAMTAVVLIAVLADVRVRPLDALGVSVAVLMLIDPFLALSVGFAMSALATAGLLLWAGRRGGDAARPGGGADVATGFPRGDPAGSLWPRAARALVGVVAVSAVAQVAVAPVIAGIGGGVPIGGVVANLLAAPAVAPATVCGLLAALVGTVAPGPATVVALPGAWAVGWIARVARTISEVVPPLPWSQGVAGALLATAVVAVGGLAVLVARRGGARLVRVCLGIAVAGGIVVVAPPAVLPHATSWPPSGWRVVMCDVGQGDATVLRTGDGTAVVVDAGPDPSSIDRCLRRLGVRHVPLLLLTHFHADHVEGVPGVLRGRAVDVVVVSPLGEPVGELARVRWWLRDADVPMRPAAPDDRWRVGAVDLRVVWPRRVLRGQGSDPNNASVTVAGSVEGTSVLLGGDLETAAQDAVLRDNGISAVDVVKVPHHGSAKQSPQWATTSLPRVALIGVGIDNDYGHPYPGTVMAYRAVGAVVGRTDLDGDLAVVLDDEGHLGLVRRGR
jgi:competence protein ComEC